MGASLVWIDDCTAAIDWDGGHAVYRMTTKQVADYKAIIETQRIKYTPPPGRKIAGTDVAFAIWRGAVFRAEDQVSPIGDTTYDDGTGYGRCSRWIHVCPITGQTWICENRSHESGY